MFRRLIEKFRRIKFSKKKHSKSLRKEKFRRTKLHFRKHLKDSNKHNVVVGGESKNKYAYMVNTHSPVSGHKKNLKLFENTDPLYLDEESYLVKAIRTDSKHNFTKPINDRTLSEEDKETVSKWFNNSKLFKKK